MPGAERHHQRARTNGYKVPSGTLEEAFWARQLLCYNHRAKTLLTTGPEVPLTQLWEKNISFKWLSAPVQAPGLSSAMCFWRKTRPCPQDSVTGAWPSQKTENMSSAFSSCCTQPGSISTAEDRNLHPQSHKRLLRRPQLRFIPTQ